MSHDSLFQTPAGIQLIEKLFAWATGPEKGSEGPLEWPISQVRQTDNRVTALIELQVSLMLAVRINQSVAERIELICHWIMQHLEGQTKETLTQLARSLESELRVQNAPMNP